MSIRKIATSLISVPTIEGAGVHLKRAFGYHQAPQFDPFLMLDDFHTSNPDQYLAGFPWHPHRGIETITYILEGLVEHGDSMGNKGVIGAGDVQWMTAGSGIIHQEMPKESPTGTMWGFQLWANLPAAQKMMAPRYRDVKAEDIPEVTQDDGVTIKIIAGMVGSIQGPVKDILIQPELLGHSGRHHIFSQHPGRLYGICIHPCRRRHVRRNQRCASSRNRAAVRANRKPGTSRDKRIPNPFTVRCRKTAWRACCLARTDRETRLKMAEELHRGKGR